MSPLFGGSDKADGGTGGSTGPGPEIERLRSLSLEQLAEEVISRGFSHDETADGGRTSVHDLAQNMVPDFLRGSQEQIWEVEGLIGEGVQLLAQGRLVQSTVVGADRRLQWVLTRRGRAVVADGTVGRILAEVA